MTSLTEVKLADCSKGGSVALIGCHGFNVSKRLLGELAQVEARLVGYDRTEPSDPTPSFETVTVCDDADLARQLNRQRPSVVLIETPDDTHANLIRTAINSGANRIFCEKPLALSQDVAEQLTRICLSAEPDQQVFILDHYPNVLLVELMTTSAPRWLGEIKLMEVVLLEDLDLPPNQVRSHAAGMTNFIHHFLAMAAMLFDLRDLKVTEAVWARHPDAKVPDTFRGMTLRHRIKPDVILRGCVGKYIRQPWKQIHIDGTQGSATLNRSKNELKFRFNDGWQLTTHTPSDTGYRGLGQCLASGKPLPGFLTVHQASEAVRLIVEAHKIAVELTAYPDGSEAFFGPGERIALRPAA